MLSIRSGRSKKTFVSSRLKLPWSSLNFKIYWPSRLATIASVVFPAKAGIRSTEFWNVPVASVLLLCRTYTLPPWITSGSVDSSHLNLIFLLSTGSIVRLATGSGGSVFPFASKVKALKLDDRDNPAL